MKLVRSRGDRPGSTGRLGDGKMDTDVENRGSYQIFWLLAYFRGRVGNPVVLRTDLGGGGADPLVYIC